MHSTMSSYGVEPQGYDVHALIPYHLKSAKEFIVGSVGQYRHKRNFVPMIFHDMRSTRDEFHLDKQGFQILSHESAEGEYNDTERIKSIVYKEAEKLIRKASDATKALAVTHIIRKTPPEVAQRLAADPSLKDDDIAGVVVPSPGVHIDRSEKGALEFFQDNVSANEFEKYRNSRWAIINVWIPIKTIERDPLCLCDYRSVSEEDLLVTRARLPTKGTGTFDNISKGGTFEVYEMNANPVHKWYYASFLKPDEALLLKIFDSKKSDGVARRVPHCSFNIPGTEDKPARESIDVRCLAFFEEEPIE